jgi:ectoine hydroxylase-related dioxygenase (phytanoyl-CoA dioxygenase family)
MRERFAEDGYLLARGLLDPRCVGQLAASAMEVLRNLGVLTGEDHTVNALRAVNANLNSAMQRHEPFHALSHDPSLLRVARVLVGDDAFVLPQRLLRAIRPGIAELTTPPHQDFAYIRGSRSTVTMWLPLTPCRVGEGALRILVGSAARGLLPMKSSSTIAGFRVDVADDDPAWASTDFEPGDVLLFNSMTVHGATPNTSDRVRLSVDYRCQSASEPVVARSLKPHGYPEVPDWPELLADASWSYSRWLSVPRNIRIVDASLGASEEP